ncbi:Pumilio domain-containing protein-like protein [Emericellopsis cladophorae]|uniref:Pumilio domain-containing protein-like protein n=1 Tax=Emericellopsis cladophorae TaxID=2686198 RepID=A0A9P9XYS6_9HYPO|nr:Pumilio domain-containing protein-like protein [Emericellopsis cladophorae]KAI6780373.1 Pumilio domain-containing protein-like protein [Emericellopsis cladophorae]
MPGSRPRNGAQDNAGLDTANITRFLWDDEEGGGNSHYNASDMGFPTLTRTEDQILSASSAALDLALSSSPNPETSSHNWSTSINRHRPQQSLSALNGPSSSTLGTLGHRPASLRQSLDLNYIAENSENAPGSTTPTQASHTMAAPRLQSSYSSNDVPTVKSPTGSTSGNANNHAQQHFHNHNASIGRIPTGVLSSSRGHSRQLSQETNTNGNAEQPANTYPSIQSTLHANAPVFGPGSGTSQNMNGQQLPATSQGPMHPGFQPYYPVNPYMPGLNGVNGMPVNYGAAPANGNYNINMLTAGMQNMGMNGAMNGNMTGMAPMYPGQNFVPPYNPMPYNNGNTNGNANNGGNANMGQQALQQPRDSQARVMQNRRQADNEAMSRYSGLPLEHFHGQIYELCKDQHGCRYLQKKLEEQNPDAVHMIWLETNQHVIELMTDPFGNYLCQKLLEYCNDEERTILIQNAAQDMVRIALNTHGTRALQKMIEYVQSPQQIQVIIEALRFRVVELIQDLNGNHVIQKCLNKLSSPNSQFIFDAVGGSCVEVGTHRHGCCVLQRCIDHASGEQKLWLIQRITEHARVLVQDPFGNYVVQYIIDLGEPTFTEPIVATFQGCVSQLSRHKFSSNVMEKCLRCALPPSKDMIVEEMISAQEIERLIRDSYANYVVQTALEYATPSQKHRLVEAIRPVLPSIRNTPYGRRIQAKISTYDGRGSVTASGQATPADNTQGQIPLRPAHQARGPAVNGGSGHSSQTGSQVLEQALNAYQNSGAQQSPANGHGSNNNNINNNQGHMNGNVTQPPSGQQGQQGNGGPWM